MFLLGYGVNFDRNKWYEYITISLRIVQYNGKRHAENDITTKNPTKKLGIF